MPRAAAIFIQARAQPRDTVQGHLAGVCVCVSGEVSGDCVSSHLELGLCWVKGIHWKVYRGVGGLFVLQLWVLVSHMHPMRQGLGEGKVLRQGLGEGRC